VNYRIRVPQVRCLDADGNMLGVIPTDKARTMASQQGLDLVEISPNADPPVCRIMDFGKYRYEEAKKERIARKNQHSLALKEVKFHVTVEEHDYQTKINNMKKFLTKGHKVKISLFFRGRENVHRELGFRLFERVFKDCSDVGAIELAPKLIGRGIFGVLTPRPSTKAGVKPAAPAVRPPDAAPVAAAKPPAAAVPVPPVVKTVASVLAQPVRPAGSPEAAPQAQPPAR
jgi:translation initiation factor IF-3